MQRNKKMWPIIKKRNSQKNQTQIQSRCWNDQRDFKYNKYVKIFINEKHTWAKRKFCIVFHIQKIQVEILELKRISIEAIRIIFINSYQRIRYRGGKTNWTKRHAHRNYSNCKIKRNKIFKRYSMWNVWNNSKWAVYA